MTCLLSPQTSGTLYKNLDKQPDSPEVPVAQWLEYPTSVTEVEGSIRNWYSDFSSVILSPIAMQTVLAHHLSHGRITPLPSFNTLLTVTEHF